MSHHTLARLCVALIAAALLTLSLAAAALASPLPLTATPYPTATVYPTPAPRAYLPLLYARGAGSAVPSISFWADRYVIEKGDCLNLRWRVDAVAQVMLEGSPVAWTGYRMICPQETHGYRLDVAFASGAQASWTLSVTVNDPPVQALFWSEGYTLAAGDCAALHWHVSGALAIHLDGVAVPGTGTQQACPVANMQFYTLEVVYFDGYVAFYQVILRAGDPMLQPGEVIAQAVVSDLAPVSDIDPTEPGAQPGYQMTLEGVRLLYAADPSWDYAQVTLTVPKSAVDLGPYADLHWPLRIGQHVEFRAACASDACLLDYTTEHYLYMTSE